MLHYSLLLLLLAPMSAIAADFTDTRDGQVYPTIELGSQIWLGKNLNFASESSWCYDNLDTNCEEFGRLYSWTAAELACPHGWHSADDADWQELEQFLGMSVRDLGKSGFGTIRGSREGEALRMGGASQMNIPMAGYKYGNEYHALREKTYLWAGSAQSPGIMYRRRIESDAPTVFRFTNPPGGFAISVRCLMAR